MLDFQPVVTRRLWNLRQMPAFSAAEIHELALLAENVSDATFSQGELVAPRGPAGAVHFIVDGEIEQAGRTWGVREAFGLLEVLAARELGAPARATRPTRALRLLASDLPEVLEEGFGVLRGTLHELAARVAWKERPRSPAIAIPPYEPLGLVDRLVVLRQLPPFGSARLDALGALAHAAEETTVAPGAWVARTGTRATTVHVILDGTVRVTSGDETPITLGPGAAVGGVEVFGELFHAYSYEAMTRVRTLACSSSAMFDVLEDHTELGLAVLASFASALL